MTQNKTKASKQNGAPGGKGQDYCERKSLQPRIYRSTKSVVICLINNNFLRL